MKSDRVTLRADDALTAFTALRTSIRGLDEILLERDFATRNHFLKMREQDWQAYQRIAKALGLPPTLDRVEERKSA
jgi:hypothetical protein